MKNFKLFLFVGVIISIISCNTNPNSYPAPVYVQQEQPGADYQVIVDPMTGQQQVIYVMNGAQYVIPYVTFMGWYNQGGYGYVNRMYSTNHSYFNSYNSNKYRGWKSSSFRDSYSSKNYRKGTVSSGSYNDVKRPTTNTKPSYYGGSKSNSFGSSSKSSSNSFGSSSRQNKTSSSFGSSSNRSSSSKSSSSFGSKKRSN